MLITVAVCGALACVGCFFFYCHRHGRHALEKARQRALDPDTGADRPELSCCVRLELLLEVVREDVAVGVAAGAPAAEADGALQVGCFFFFFLDTSHYLFIYF
jgi:hypothetical protein